MKILEMTNYTAGGCGVWARARQESQELIKRGYQVHVFSSNFTKGTNQIANHHETQGKLQITRFPAIMPGKGWLKYIPGGESYMFWKFKEVTKKALEYNPDIIIAHAYRHPHTLQAIKIGRKLKIPVILVTHAPFDRDDTRSIFSKISVWFYDKFIGKHILKKFSKIIAITKWEMPYLRKLGIKDPVYIPNGIPEEFFTPLNKPKKNTLLFFSRVAPIKSIETVLEALPFLDNKIKFEIRGPTEKEYELKLKKIIKAKYLQVDWQPAVYDIEQKKKIYDAAEMFILPSKSEGMPQALIEAMSRGKIVIASDIPATLDIITKNNGFLFQKENPQDLVTKLEQILSLDQKEKDKISKEAQNSVKEFSWKNISAKIERTLQDLRR